MSDAFSLIGRKALVTGGSSGIGRAIALGLAGQGADVAIHHLGDAAGAEAVCAEIRAAGRSAFVHECDFLRSGSIEGLVNAAVAQLGQVDIVIANAAIERRMDWLQIDRDHLADHMTANFASLIRLCQLATPPMAERGWGRVVAIGSVMASRPRAETIAYAAMKSAQRTAIRAMAREVAHRGVTMNVVSPGAIETERTAGRYGVPAFRRAVVAKIPVRRPGVPQDCVGPVLLLCSDAASYVTGADIPVDGGWTIGDAPGALPGEAA